MTFERSEKSGSGMLEKTLIDIKEEARVRYFKGEYSTVESLAEDLKVSLHTLKNWVYYGIKDEEPLRTQKQRDQAQALKEIIQASYLKDRMLKESLTDLGLKVAGLIAKGVESGAYEPGEHAKLLNAISLFKRVSDAGLRLDEGKSTSNVEVKHTKEESLADLAQRASEEDPFNDSNEHGSGEL